MNPRLQTSLTPPQVQASKFSNLHCNLSSKLLLVGTQIYIIQKPFIIKTEQITDSIAQSLSNLLSMSLEAFLNTPRWVISLQNAQYGNKY